MDIKNIVEKLINKHNTNCPFKLADKLNIHILYEPLGATLGYFSRDFRLKFIHINQNLSTEAQIFVCAHEIGHAILHPDVNTPFLSRHTLFSISKIEREANTFAVEFLMPDSLIHDEYECMSLFDIANICGIPPQMAILKTISKSGQCPA